jgi:hypothetical protein
MGQQRPAAALMTNAGLTLPQESLDLLIRVLLPFQDPFALLVAQKHVGALLDRLLDELLIPAPADQRYTI